MQHVKLPRMQPNGKRSAPQLDVYPAVVTRPQGGAYNNVRVYVEDGEAYVFGADRSGRMLLIDRLELHELRRSQLSKTHPHVLMTTDGEQWEVQQSGGCPCSSPLKRFEPRARVAQLRSADVQR